MSIGRRILLTVVAAVTATLTVALLSWALHLFGMGFTA